MDWKVNSRSFSFGNYTVNSKMWNSMSRKKPFVRSSDIISKSRSSWCSEFREQIFSVRKKVMVTQKGGFSYLIAATLPLLKYDFLLTFQLSVSVFTIWVFWIAGHIFISSLSWSLVPYFYMISISHYACLYNFVLKTAFLT